MEDLVRKRSVAAGKWLAKPPAGQEVVISGISGRFPCSDNLEQFKENLFNKVDMVTSTNHRWDLVHPDLPKRLGKINHIEKFDPGYFGVHRRESDIMDPMFRCLMERVVEAIYDAGVNPKELEGTKTGVYVGSINTDCQRQLMRHDLPHENYALTGICRFSLPNRISYILKLNGPSYVLDTACSSSLYALNQAYEDIRKGEIDAAIIGITVLNLHPLSTLQFVRLGVLSPDGASKTFDDSANGYARAEVVTAIFLQKSKDARRVYSTVVHCKANCDGYKEQGITFPSADQQRELLQEFYEECDVDPSTVDYVEAHGTGTRVGDFEEIRPIDEIFCTGRDSYLPVGSVKSNMGHSEPGAGLCQIAKAIITLETGLIPPNLHFHKPRDGVDAFESGRVRIVSEKTPLPGKSGLIAISSFGFGGSNGHTLVRWNEKTGSETVDTIPRLACVSARTEGAVVAILDSLQPFNGDLIALLHQLFKHETPSQRYRGYAIVSRQDGEICRTVEKIREGKRRFCLEFGDARAGFLKVAREFSCIPLAFEVFQKVEKILSGRDFSVKNCQHSLVSDIVATTAVQIAIFEVLHGLGVAPSVITANSYGKFAKAYAEGLLSLELALKTVYNLARHFLDSKQGTWELWNDIKNDLSTQKGELDFKAYECVQEIFDSIKSPSIIQQNGHVGSEEINDDLVTLQVGSATKLTTGDVFYLPHQEDSFILFLKLIGRLHQGGYTLNLEKLYPPISFPVGRGTPSISPLIQWDHEEDWFVISYRNSGKSERLEKTIVVNLKESEWSFILGHVIDGRNLFPATGYLYIVWHTLAMSVGKLIEDTEVVFEKVRFNRATTISKDGSVQFLVSIQKGSGFFEVVEGDAAVVTGNIFLKRSLREEYFDRNVEIILDEKQVVPQEKDVYKELRLRGYNYSGLFKSIRQCDPFFHKASVEWHGNWIAFMDNMLQLQILDVSSRDLFVPIFIQRLTIDAGYHLQFAASQNDRLLPVFYYKEFSTLKSGGIEIRGLNASGIAKKKPLGDPVLERHVFVPNETQLGLEESIRINMQIVLENSYRIKVKVVELLEEDEALTPSILNALGDQPLIQAEAVVLTEKSLDLPGVKVENKQLKSVGESLVVVGSKLLKNQAVLEEAISVISENGYILTREALRSDVEAAAGMQILTKHETPAELLVLMRKWRQPHVSDVVRVGEDTSAWLQYLQNALRTENNVVIYSQGEPCSGILGLTNCIRKEAGGESCRCVVIQDETSPPFRPDSEYYREQLEKGFAMNVLRNGKWGTYRHLLLEEDIQDGARHAVVEVNTKGDLSSLRWVNGPLSGEREIGFAEKLVEVHYSSLNFRDIMTATGRMQFNTSSGFDERDFLQGIEYSGIDLKGERVMGVVVGGALSTLVLADKVLTFPVPQDWSLEEAATVPAVYLTVLFALVDRARIRKGQSILIHAGSGGIGQAAINVCHHYGLEIFTTIGTEQKRKFIRETFPFIKTTHIGNSRDCSFEQMVQRETRGRGVDLVLNSLAEEKLQASVRCLAKSGIFLEIGKFDLMNESALDLELFRREATFCGVHLDRIFRADPNSKRRIMKLLADAMEAGAVKPLPRSTFGVEQVEEAFRFMASGGHIGKVLVKVREEGLCRVSSAVPKYYCETEGCCVVAGGLGGFGLELVDWLVKRGARKIVLSSRSGIKSGYQGYRISTWRSEGVQVVISNHDITKEGGCEALLREANSLGPVVSIYNLAVVLADALFENQTEDNFKKSLSPKAEATKHLDRISRKLCPKLKDFVVFSSVSCGRGNAGQTNYGTANSIMERICEERKKQGLPGLAIQWGAVGDVGLVAEMQTEDILLEIGGTLQQRISSCLQVLDRLLTQREAAVVSSMVVAEKRSASGRADNIVDAVANIIGVRDIKTVSAHSTLPELGMDSMMATEIKQTMEREFEIFLTVKDVRNLTFAKLHEIMSAKATAELQTPAETTKDEEYRNFVRNVGTKETAKELLVRLPSAVETQEKAKVLTKNLPCHVFCAQYCHESFDEIAVPDISAKLLPLIEAKADSTSFALVGYSFGCVIALEVASKLERKGSKGTVFLIDGSPRAIVQLAKQQTSHSADVLQLNIFEAIVSNYLPTKEIAILMADLSQVRSPEEREDVFLSRVSPPSPENRSYYKNLLRKIQQRSRAVIDYVPTYTRIDSKLILCKPSAQSVQGESEEYGLSEVASDVTVLSFSGNHTSILKSDELSHALSQEMLQD